MPATDTPSPVNEARPRGVTYTLEPDGETLGPVKANTVLRLLNLAGKRHTAVLVIRDGRLLTPDVRLFHGDHVILRNVTSSG